MAGNERLQFSIEARTSGEEQLNRLSNSLTKVSDTSDQITSSFANTARETERSLAGITRTAGEFAAGTAGAYAAMSAAVAKYIAVTSGAGGATEALVNTTRALRFVLSPTIFTAASLAVGILAEQTFKLVAARSKLIEQQSLLAAQSGLSFTSIQQIGTASNLSGANPKDITAALSKLRDSLSSSSSQDALATLGVPAHFRGTASPELLAQIAKGFSDIPDPVKRADAAVKLFGGELAEKVLPQLNRQFAESSRAVSDWALTLDDTSRNNIYTFRRDIQNFADDIAGLATPTKSAWERVKQEVVAGVSNAYAAVREEAAREAKRRETVGLPDLGTLYRSLFFDEADAKAVIAHSLGTSQIRGQAAGQSATADLLSSEARAAIEHRALTREGLQSRLGSLQGLRETAEAALRSNQTNPGELTPEQVRDFASFLLGAEREIGSLQGSIRGFEITRRQVEALRNSRELVTRSTFEPSAGRNLAGEIQRATTFTDQDGNLQHYALLDETRRNLLQAFAAYALDVNRQVSAAQIKSEEDLYQRKRALQEDLWKRRAEYIAETARLELETIDRSFGHESTLAGYRREERLQRQSISIAGSSDPNSVSNTLNGIIGGADIERDYLTQVALTKASAITRARDRQLAVAGLANVDSDYDRGLVGDADYDRAQVIRRAAGQEGTELNDQYVHDLLTVQQQAVLDTTRVIKDLENEQIRKVQSLTVSLFDAVTSGNAARGLAQTIRSEFLDIGRTLTANATKEFLFPAVKNLIPHAGSPDSTAGRLFKDTLFAADPLKNAGVTLNAAGIKLDVAADKLLGSSGAGFPGATSSIPGAATALGSIFGRGTSPSNPFIFNAKDGSITLGPSGGLPFVYGTSDINNISGATTRAPLSLGSKVGIAGAAAGGAFTAYDQFRHGDLRGAIGGTGALAGAAGSILALSGATGPLAPVLAGVGLALGLVTSLFGDPKKARENEINDAIQRNRYLAPEALNVSQDTSGNYVDFDARGNLRNSPFRATPQVQQPYAYYDNGQRTDVPGREISPYQPAVVNNYYTNNINAIDTQSFGEAVRRNPAAVVEVITDHVQDESGRLTAAIRYATS